MPLKDMPAFIFSHKNVLRAVICALVSCFLLIAQLVLMRKTVITVIFDIIIPFNGAVILGCYAITMAMDRPAILAYPPTIYFVSLLVSKLLAVEVGEKDTYYYLIFLQLIPYLSYCVSVCTGKFKKTTRRLLILGCVMNALLVLTAVILASMFNFVLYSRVNQAIAWALGLLSIIANFIAMLEHLKIAGCQKRQRLKKIRIFF